jgi:hypothetical protein
MKVMVLTILLLMTKPATTTRVRANKFPGNPRGSACFIIRTRRDVNVNFRRLVGFKMSISLALIERAFSTLSFVSLVQQFSSTSTFSLISPSNETYCLQCSTAPKTFRCLANSTFLLFGRKKTLVNRAASFTISASTPPHRKNIVFSHVMKNYRGPFLPSFAVSNSGIRHRTYYLFSSNSRHFVGLISEKGEELSLCCALSVSFWHSSSSLAKL